jgi:hypothetical protein
MRGIHLRFTASSVYPAQVFPILRIEYRTRCVGYICVLLHPLFILRKFFPFCALNTEHDAWDTFAFYYILFLSCTSFQSSLLTKYPCQTGLQYSVSIFEMGHSSFRRPFRHSIQTGTPPNASKVPQSIVPLMSLFLHTAAIYSYFL